MQFLSLFLACAVPASVVRPLVHSDREGLWSATWSIPSWRCDSSRPPRRIVAAGLLQQTAPGAFDVPVVDGVVALPPDGDWSVRVARDSTVFVPGEVWGRTPGWRGGFPVEAAPAVPPPWVEEWQGKTRILRLAIPLAEPAAGGMSVARRISVEVTMRGTGSGALPEAIRSIALNPLGGARFARAGAGPVVARRAAVEQERLVPDGDQCAVLTVRDPSPGDMSGSRVVSVSGTQLSGVLGSLLGIDFDRVAVGAGDLGAIAITDSAGNEPGLAMIPIRRVDRDGDGVFDPEDRIEFFARSPSWWTRDRVDSSMGRGIRSLDVHPWDLARRYLIRLDAAHGSPELPVGHAPASVSRSASVLRPVWAGKHAQLWNRGRGETDRESGTGWFWQWLPPGRYDSARLHHPASIDLPGLSGSEGIAVVRLAGMRVGSTGARDTLRSGTVRPVFLGASPGRSGWKVGGLKPVGNAWRLNVASDTLDFESYTVHYPYAPTRSGLVPFPAPGAGAFGIAVGGASATDSVVAVERGTGVRVLPLAGGELRDSARTDETWYVPATAVPVASTALSRWSAARSPSVLSPARMPSSRGVELVIVAPDSFVDLAVEHAAFRSDARRIRPLATRVVRTEDLWLLWGRGSQDPLAIRGMLRYAREHWGTTHVLLMGGGHHDPRGLTGSVPGPIPVWEDYHRDPSSDWLNDDVSASSDVVLTYLDVGSLLSQMSIGRIPARSRAEVSAALRKIHVWEDPSVAATGPWRNTFLAVADDLYKQEGAMGRSLDDGFEGARGHTEESEAALDQLQTARPWMQLRKVYEVEYPINALGEMPDAQRALLDQLNRGVGIFQYFGHGGWGILSHERLLDTRSALAGLGNTHSPFLFVAASCNVGRHDMGAARGFAEALVVTPGKGAVASIASTRISSGGSNGLLLQSLWGQLFRTKADGTPRTIGEALRDARNRVGKGSSYYPNDAYYDLLGDPAMVLFPAGSALSLENAPDTLAALDVRDVTGSAEAELQVSLVASSTPRTASFLIDGTTYTQSYALPGRTMMAVRAKASDGRYLARLLTPARIPFGDTATLHVYGWNPATLRDSAVIDSKVVFSGVGNNAVSDNAGPRIRVLPCDSSWSGGQPFGRTVEVPIPFCMNIVFDDSSGISSSDGPDEGVVLSIPGTLDPWHPMELREGRDFTQAWTRLSLDAATFAPGKTYPLRIFARDLMGNASSASLEIHARAAGEIDLYEVFNRPNPAKGSGTTFYFKLLSDADSNGIVPSTVQASIRIHTISGKLVRVLHTDLSQVGQPRPRAVWDLKDSFRNDVANGLYPYTVILRVKDQEGRNWRQIERRGIVAVSR